MSDNDNSQQGSGQGKKKGGLTFMGLQMAVFDKRRDLQKKGKLPPSEYFLLEEIEAATIGARNDKGKICSKTSIRIEDLSKRMGYKEKDKIWKLLKSLHFKKYILREATEIKGIEIIGINPKVFGQILIESQHALEHRRHLKLAVDNSKNDVGNSNISPTDHRSFTDRPSVNHGQTVGESPTDRRLFPSQPHEIIKEKTSLDPFRVILDSFRGKKETSSLSETDEEIVAKNKAKFERQKKELGL